ncbi:DUF4269 domain-containing protein [Chryseobacterium gossypii]|uniref:DUF4269 domain-containing protein n=1 Tax=Chryseobacterium gossypii TaxID=3231602 RepID=UPI00352350EE
MIDFTRLDYLKNGNERQKRAYEVLSESRLFEKLKKYSPVLAGTIPLGIDVEGSDLDIICEVNPRLEDDFVADLALNEAVPENSRVRIERMIINGEKSIIVNFMLDEFPVEIFGQNKPVTGQNAYRHMIAEYKILKEKGRHFKQKIIELKKKGIKTEPAFGMLLNLQNPYEDLLKF